MEKKLLEAMAEKVHDAWWGEKKEQGFHNQKDCDPKNKPPSEDEVKYCDNWPDLTGNEIVERELCRGETRAKLQFSGPGCQGCDHWITGKRITKNEIRGFCSKCHKDMKPYSELDDTTKNLDRVMVMKFEIQLEELGYIILRKIDMSVPREASLK